MRVVMTYENEYVGQHFGRTEYFKLYDIQDGIIQNEQVVSTNGQGHGALIGVLEELKADALICGGIGMGARSGLEELNIDLLPGVEGKCDDVIKAYLDNTLSYDVNASCNHHHEHDHDCHHENGREGHHCH